MTAVALTTESNLRRRWRWAVFMATLAGLAWLALLQLYRAGVADMIVAAETAALEARNCCGEWNQSPIKGDFGTVARWRECELQFTFHTARFVHVEYEEPPIGVRNENIQVEIRWWPALIACGGIMLAAAVAVILLAELWRWLFGGRKAANVT